jgi:deoxyribodipyrimidine photolyase-related protein
MSTHCGSCRFNPKKRTGDDACPLTTLYWDFLARNRNRLANNGRLQPQLRGLDRLSDLEAVRSRAAQVLDDLDTGNL